MLVVEPQLHLVEEMEPGPVNHAAAVRLVLGAEENSCRKTPFEALSDALVMEIVWWQSEKVEHLGGGSYYLELGFQKFLQGFKDKRVIVGQLDSCATHFFASSPLEKSS